MYIACDIGGTQFRVAKSEDLVEFDEPIIEETPTNPKEGLKLIATTIRNLVKKEKVEAIIFGIAGIINPTHEFLLKSNHLKAWERVPIKEFFEKEFGAKVFIENDSAMVGLGEALAGAGKGFDSVVYITVSTGIGGAKIVRGKFEKNKFGFEPGYQILNNETGENWEDLASGTAVEKKYKKHPKEVAKTAHWQKIERNVAIGIHNSILHWSPDVVVVGGSMAKDLNADRLKEEISKLMKIHPEIPEIRLATLGSIGGIFGGFAYLKNIL
ncbi:MAG TPA: ROK family protein [Candidatus Paceibacterota bacterium]|nr:ROK family protein [Candidatus Paceibacterota bacterium]HRZ34665.1 ROK family protein [Candidatus Paceibacterota bacterium]